jgi:UDP-N-acetylglucosamine 2-epimerase (non-hydrolysing)
MPQLDIIAGARPNFVKVASIIRALQAHRAAGGALRYRLVHTGQHYDEAMSGSFFEQLGIAAPHVNLGVGSGTQAEQTAGIMRGYEKLLTESGSDACVVVGDVTSTMACAITARKCGLPVAHVEAGIRSNDWRMTEEINRVVTDSVSNWFFTTSESASANLRASGADPESIFFVGNTMIDTLLNNLERLRRPPEWESMGLTERGYIVLTLHRPTNVDNHETFARLITGIAESVRGYPVVFPVHPRTLRTLELIGELPKELRVITPQPYLEFNYLVRHAFAVITDSGGITEETTVLGIPCMTLRDSTERPETVTVGTNELLGTDPKSLAPALDRLFAGQWKSGSIPERWDGRAGERIVDHLSRLVV